MSRIHGAGRLAGLLSLLVCTLPLVSACSPLRASGYEAFDDAVEQGDALAISDALEARIAQHKDSYFERKKAFRAVRDRDEDTAAFQFAWAALAGRVVEQKGLLGAEMVPKIEAHARRSRELDANFRGGAATRLLGTLYVIAPSKLLEHGNSELGLELLEGLAEKAPEVPENQLRLGEAYIALGDPDPAVAHLCAALRLKNSLRNDEQELLRRLVADVSPIDCSKR